MTSQKLPQKKFLETFKYVPRVALNILVKNIKGDARGHIIDLIYEFKYSKNIIFNLTKETAEITFFKILPLMIGFNQREILNKLGYK